MTDFRFTDKRGGGSLARRVLLLACSLLVFPLLLYGLLLLLQDLSLFTEVPGESALKISKENLIFHISLLFLLIFVLGGFLTWWLTKRMARPLKGLTHAMARVGEGHLSSRYQKDLLGFEINLLGAQFNQMVENLVRYIEEVKKEKLAKELLLNELKIGHEIQKQIFPKEIPEVPGVQISGRFLPALEVTGDFYDLFFKNESKTLVLTLGDAAGKGISACLFALVLRSLLRAAFHCKEGGVGEVIRKANSLFSQDTRDSGYFATAWIGELDLKTRTLEYTSCGHLPAFLLRKKGGLEELGAEGIALGIEGENRPVTATCALSPGDLLILYSDGIVEAHSTEQKLFGRERLEQVILEVREASAEQITSHVLERVQQFALGAPQHDDLTLLVVKIL